MKVQIFFLGLMCIAVLYLLNFQHTTAQLNPSLEVLLVSPQDSENVAQNVTFLVNATVYCRDGFCGNVSGVVRYNATSEYPDTNISTTTGDTPFYITDKPNPQNCSGNPLEQDEYCELTWNVNATGSMGSSYKIAVVFYSNETGVSSNQTSNNTVNIISCIIDITLSWNNISFVGGVGETVNASGNDNQEYNVTVETTTTCNIDIYISGTNFTHTEDSRYVIPVENLVWSNTTNNYSQGYSLKKNWNRVNTSVSPGTNTTLYFWFDVPLGILAGPYNGSVYIKVVEAGVQP